MVETRVEQKNRTEGDGKVPPNIIRHCPTRVIMFVLTVRTNVMGKMVSTETKSCLKRKELVVLESKNALLCFSTNSFRC